HPAAILSPSTAHCQSVSLSCDRCVLRVHSRSVATEWMVLVPPDTAVSTSEADPYLTICQRANGSDGRLRSRRGIYITSPDPASGDENRAADGQHRAPVRAAKVGAIP